MLLCGSVLVAPLLFPKSSTSAETQVAFARADAVRDLPSADAGAPDRPHLLLDDLLTPATSAVARPAHAVTHAHHAAAKSTAKATSVKSKASAKSSTKTSTKATTKKATASSAPALGPASSTGHSETGGASWYDAPAGTCAHRSLPRGLVITVTNLANGKQVTCRVSDRGPYVDGRVIDLSRSAFQALASSRSGVINVRIDW